MPKCELCEKECSYNEGRKFSPRDLQGMEPKVADTSAVTLQSVASSIIMFNNPPGAANQPMWWICHQCVGRCYSKGRSRGSVQMDQAIFGMMTGHRQKRWWQFWK